MDSSRKRALLVSIIVFIILLGGPAYLGGVYVNTDFSLTSQTVVQQQTLSDIASLAIKTKLDRLVGIDAAMASSSQLSSYVANGQWDQASAFTRDLLNDVNYYDPYIDRVIIFDKNGTQQSAYPELTGGVGTSAVGGDWYTGIAQTGSTYVSGVIKRRSSPQINVVNVSAVIKNGGQTVGFVVMQIPTDHFLEFGQTISLGNYGFAYLVDAKGNLVAHPRFSSDTGGVINYTFDPAVASVIKGEQGVAVLTVGGEESVVSYKPVPLYGWGVVTQEPYYEAFGNRDSILTSVLWETLIAIILDLLGAYLVYRVMVYLYSNRKESKKRAPKKSAARRRKGFTLIELLVVIAIIAILSIVVILTLNPAELLKQSRDSGRISDLATLKSAVSLYLIDTSSPNIVSSSFGYTACYVSTISGGAGTTTARCGVFTSAYLVGNNVSSSAANYRKIDSTGWVPINFSALSYGSPFGTLPIDPINNTGTYYSYAATSSGGNSFVELDAILESIKYTNNMTNDGGNNSSSYETGTQPGLNL